MDINKYYDKMYEHIQSDLKRGGYIEDLHEAYVQINANMICFNETSFSLNIDINVSIWFELDDELLLEDVYGAHVFTSKCNIVYESDVDILNIKRDMDVFINIIDNINVLENMLEKQRISLYVACDEECHPCIEYDVVGDEFYELCK